MKNKFNEAQKKAVEWKSGPCLVLAGPGSGKTFVLTNRLLNLILHENIDPQNILVITFTRAAANEMKDRFIRLLDENAVSKKNIPTFGTFHSVFFEILKENFGYKNDSLIEKEDERRILFNVLESYKDINVTSDILDNFIKDIKSYKLSVERQEYFKPRYESAKLFDRVYKDYQEVLFNEKKLDFFDMIDKCKTLLYEYDDVRNFYNEKYQYILIDEFQDINKSQYDLVKLICKNKNLFVVGDDDQSIYRFRGSHPKVMRDFLNDYRHAKVINLNTNYRCAKVIVKFSKLVIENNADRFKKDLVSGRVDVGELEIKAFTAVEEENDYIVKKINEYKRLGIDYNDMAILYRTNLLVHSIRGKLIKQNIPFRLRGDSIDIYDNFAVSDIMAYLKLATSEKDSKSLIQIANKPLRYISRDAIGYVDNGIDDVIKYYENKDFMLKYLSKFKHELYTIRNNITPLAIRYIRSEVGYDEYLYKYCEKNEIDYDEISEILDIFEEESIGHNDIREFLDYTKKQKSDNKKIINEESTDVVSLMTFHLSKGLEYKVVFIIDANDGLIPHKKSIKENDIETERRLFYVGMTRAKDNLHVFFTTRRFGKNYGASRFILEAVGGQNG